jgi:hypothetical protein
MGMITLVVFLPKFTMSEAARKPEFQFPEEPTDNVKQFELRTNPDGTKTSFRSGSQAYPLDAANVRSIKSDQTVSFLTNHDPASNTLKRKHLKSRNDVGTKLPPDSPEPTVQASSKDERRSVSKTIKNLQASNNGIIFAILILFLLCTELLWGQLHLAKILQANSSVANEQLDEAQKTVNARLDDIESSNGVLKSELAELKLTLEHQQKEALADAHKNSKSDVRSFYKNLPNKKIGRVKNNLIISSKSSTTVKAKQTASNNSNATLATLKKKTQAHTKSSLSS